MLPYERKYVHLVVIFTIYMAQENNKDSYFSWEAIQCMTDVFRLMVDGNDDAHDEKWLKSYTRHGY